MNRLRYAQLLSVLLLLTCYYTGYSADTLTTKYPAAILVQLRSEQNRIEALTKDRQYKELEEVKNDAVEIKQKMINDFTDHYHSCPVYYYIDTNIDLIKQKKFVGVLMNKDGALVTNPVINNQSNDYVIVYYGYGLSQNKTDHVVSDTGKYTYDPDSRPGKGLVVLNAQFQQIDNFYKYGYDEALFKLKKKNKRYFYVSKHFDMEYFPFANLLEENMGDRHARHRIAPGPSEAK